MIRDIFLPKKCCKTLKKIHSPQALKHLLNINYIFLKCHIGYLYILNRSVFLNFGRRINVSFKVHTSIIGNKLHNLDLYGKHLCYSNQANKVVFTTSHIGATWGWGCVVQGHFNMWTGGADWIKPPTCT